MDDWTKDFYENKATLECDVCGSLLIGDEPRMVITCDNCKKKPEPDNWDGSNYPPINPLGEDV